MNKAKKIYIFGEKAINKSLFGRIQIRSLLLAGIFIIVSFTLITLKTTTKTLAQSPCSTGSIGENSNDPSNRGSAGSLIPNQQWAGTSASNPWNQQGYLYWSIHFYSTNSVGSTETPFYDSNRAVCQIDTVGTGTGLPVTYGNVQPVDVRLGKPALVGGDANSGKWRATAPGVQQVPFEQQFRDIVAGGYGGTNMAAFVDDAGYALINNSPLFCVNVSICHTAPFGSVAYPDITTQTQSGGSAHGAGYLMVADNNPDISTGNPPTNRFRSDWYQAGADSSINSVGRSGGFLAPFSLELGAESTWRPGVSSEVVLTFKYPQTGVTLVVDPVCSNKLVNGTISPAPGSNVTVRVTVDNFSYDIVSNGGSFSINLPDQNQHTVSATYSGNQSNTVTYGPCNQPPPPSGCTTLPNYPSPNVDVSLPDQTPQPQSGPPAYGYGSYTQNVPQGKTQVTSINDISSGGARVPPTEVSESYQNVTLDYSPYVNNYPYDNNQPSVSYTSYYNQNYYAAIGAPVYNDYYTCDYYVYYQYVSYYSYDPATGQYDIPNYATGSYCGNWTFHHDFLGYTFVQTGSASGLSAANTVNGPLMQYCYSRNFDLTRTSATNTYWSPSTENPTSANFGSDVHADFSTSHGGIGVRNALQVNTSVTANYYVRKASGQVIPYPVPGRCGGQYSTSQTSINVSDGYGTFGSADYPNTDCLSASIPPLQLGDEACFTITTSPTIGEVDPFGNTTGPRVGPVTLYGKTTTPDQQGTSCTAPIINVPYTRMYGNDIFAGGGFSGNGNSCTNAGNLLGNMGGTALGTTNQLATYAIGSISGFGSSQMVAPDTGLRFANTGGLSGQFTGSQCSTDFVAQQPAGASSAPVVGSSLNWPLVSNGASTYNGNLDIPGWGVAPIDSTGKANKIAIFVKGDVHITGNIIMTGSWSADHAPAFYVIATGNIYIDPGVTQLDGVYIAQPSNAAAPSILEGRIFTCSTNAPFDNTTIFFLCSNQLTVNGAFVAQQIKLQRTFGSMRDATASENPASAPHNCSISTISGSIIPRSVCAAEVFNFSPEIYMAQPPFIVKSTQQFDAITSLPPVL